MKIIRNLFVALLGFVGVTGANQKVKAVKEPPNAGVEVKAHQSETAIAITDKGKKQTNGNLCRG